MADLRNSHAAVILAGGRARRMDSAHKPLMQVGGRSILRRVLDAVPHARPRVVVGDVAEAQDYVVTAENPAGSGPAYAAAAGLAVVPESVPLVAILAADLPFLDPEVIAALEQALRVGGHAGAVLVDHTGARQWLCGLWRTQKVREVLTGVTPGSSMRRTLAGLAVAEVFVGGRAAPPWFDCDTPHALAKARRMADEVSHE